MERTKISTKVAICSLCLFILMMVGCMFFLKVAPHIPILLVLVTAVILGRLFGFSYQELEGGLVQGVYRGLQPIFILMLVGLIIAVWMMSGTVPTLLFYGVGLLSPEWFAPAALTICIVVSTFTGSSFTTIGTVGVALMGIAVALHVPAPLAAGAIICGACFGDKMSPLSDTTNFAAAVARVPLFTHIKHMLWTTVPALFITYVFLFVVGRSASGGEQMQLQPMLDALTGHFHITWLTLLSPIIVVILAARKYPVLPVLMTGIATGIVTAIVLQHVPSVAAVFHVLQDGFKLDTGEEMVNNIIQAGGLQSMMWSISLIVLALALGGVLQTIGFIEALFSPVRSLLVRRGHLIAATAMSSISVNVVTGEQYLSVLLPGETFRTSYKVIGLARQNLSRTLEDAGTLINPLIPWGVSGAFFAHTLQVPVSAYAPFALFLLLSPLFTIVFGYLGIGIARVDKSGGGAA
ncbi:Na+/H+ antiporter NhaC [Bacillus sp. FSL W7-1360]